MTSLEMPKRIYMPCAFAGRNDATVAKILTRESSYNMNFPLGFPPAYGCPESGEGKFVSRGEMNALGYVATQNEFARACGGIVTFDPLLAEHIGGYPAGAVLDFLDGINYCKVVSIVDNNVVDFRNVGIDGVNWARVDMAGSVKDPLSLIDVPDFDCLVSTSTQTTGSVVDSGDAAQCVGMFKSKWDGSLYISGGAKTEFGHVTTQLGPYSWGGVALVAYESDSLSGLDGISPYKPKEGEVKSVIFGRGIIPNVSEGGTPIISTSSVVTMNISKGKFYSVFLVGFNCKLTESTLTVKVATDDNA